MADAPQPRITVTENGPLHVTGLRLRRITPVYDDEGNGIEWRWGEEIEAPEEYDLCRCGQSKTLPFCDGTEKEIGWDGTEVADRGPTAERRRAYGVEPAVMTDDRKLCSHAAFCESVKGNAWVQAKAAAENPAAREIMEGMVRACPSGRLQRHETPEGPPIEEELEPLVAVVDNAQYWVRGGIPVQAADGFTYEVRNRVSLCRCGQSGNKPFCNGTHWKVEFQDPPPAAGAGPA